VSFGLVSIPVKLYTAAQSAASVSFHMLHRKCGSRIKQQLFCPKDNEVVPRDKVDPIFFDKAYYLGPDRGGEKAYGLLARAMEETRRCALAKYAARGK